MTTTRFTKALLLAPAVLLLPLAGRPMLNAEAGTSVDKTLTMTLDLEMLNGTVSVMGEEEEMGEDGLFVVSLEAIQEVTDVYGQAKEGALQSLNRFYKGMEMSYEANEESGDLEGFDTIEGATVRFERGEDGWSKSYVLEKAEIGPADDLLQGLHADMDLAALLPTEDVENGDTWTVDDRPLRSFFTPGGLPTGDEPAGQLATLFFDDLAVQFAENTSDFSIECTLVGEASDIAEIAFTYSGSATIDASEFVLAMTEITDQEEESGIPEDVDAEMEIDFEGEGTLLWNTKAGHIHSFESKLVSESVLTLDFTQDFGDQSVDIGVEADLSIDLSWDLELAEKE